LFYYFNTAFFIKRLYKYGFIKNKINFKNIDNFNSNIIVSIFRIPFFFSKKLKFTDLQNNSFKYLKLIKNNKIFLKYLKNKNDLFFNKQIIFKYFFFNRNFTIYNCLLKNNSIFFKFLKRILTYLFYKINFLNKILNFNLKQVKYNLFNYEKPTKLLLFLKNKKYINIQGLVLKKYYYLQISDIINIKAKLKNLIILNTKKIEDKLQNKKNIIIKSYKRKIYSNTKRYSNDNNFIFKNKRLYHNKFNNKIIKKHNNENKYKIFKKITKIVKLNNVNLLNFSDLISLKSIAFNYYYSKNNFSLFNKIYYYYKYNKLNLFKIDLVNICKNIYIKKYTYNFIKYYGQNKFNKETPLNFHNLNKKHYFLFKL
jgi:hypothetical protein